jgi:hypothetical protein
MRGIRVLNLHLPRCFLGKSAFVHCASAVAAASRSGRPISHNAGVTFEALSKSPTVGIDVTEIQYAAAKFILTEVGLLCCAKWPALALPFFTQY